MGGSPLLPPTLARLPPRSPQVGLLGSEQAVTQLPPTTWPPSVWPTATRCTSSAWNDGIERRAENFRVVAYPAARGSAAAHYPETNVLVPLDSVADISNTPTSKGIMVSLEPAR